MVDIRCEILSMLDRLSLLAMLRVEKGGVRNVVAELYTTLPVGQMKKCTRKSPRREMYYNAVQILDLSPRPRVHHRDRPPVNGSTPDPTHFNPKELLSNIAKWQATFPGLRQVSDEFPADEESDSYIARISGKGVSVDLRTSFVILPKGDPNIAAAIPEFAPSPSFDGVDISKHTISFIMHGLTTYRWWNHESSGWRYSKAELIAKRAVRDKWISWLYDNPELDRRVSRFSLYDTDMGVSGIPEETFLSFVTSRMSGDYEPLTAIVIPPSMPLGSPLFDQVVSTIGSSLTSLCFTIKVDSADTTEISLPSAILHLDHVCPFLIDVTIQLQVESSHDLSSAPRLIGLPNIRQLTVSNDPPRDPLVLARYLSGLGSHNCVYLHSDLPNKHFMEDFDRIVRTYKKIPDKVFGRGKKGSLESYGAKYAEAFIDRARSGVAQKRIYM